MSDITVLIDGIGTAESLGGIRLEIAKALGAAQMLPDGATEISRIFLAYSSMLERLSGYKITPNQANKDAYEELDGIAHIADFYDTFGDRAEIEGLKQMDKDGLMPVRKFYRRALQGVGSRP